MTSLILLNLIKTLKYFGKTFINKNIKILSVIYGIEQNIQNSLNIIHNIALLSHYMSKEYLRIFLFNYLHMASYL